VPGEAASKPEFKVCDKGGKTVMKCGF
jgi:hypothetical protein